MASLYSVLLSLLLLTSTSAAPIGRTGYTLNKRQNGGTAGVIYNEGGGWLVEVEIGGQTVTLNLDTGSADLWTASTLLSLEEQLLVATHGQIYDPSRSSTLVWLNGSRFEINYQDESGAAGPVGYEIISIGSTTMPNMPFGVADHLALGTGQTSRDTDGPVGLGFGYGNSIRPVQRCTFMECLMPYLPEPVFSTAFKTDGSGTIAFGSHDDSAYSGELTTISIANASAGNEGQWAYQGVQFGSGGQTFSPAPMDIGFDTGGPGLSIPADAATEYFALIGGDASTDSEGWYTYDCGSELPEFDYIFTQGASGPTTVTVPAGSIAREETDGVCSTWINTAGDRANAGMPFYSTQYMIWNQAVPTLSFAEQA